MPDSEPAGTFTGRARRTREVRFREDPNGINTKYIADIKAAPAPRPQSPPRPFGVFDIESAETIIAAALTTLPSHRNTARSLLKTGLGDVLTHLAGFDGDTWQRRWVAAGLDNGGARGGLAATLFPDSKHRRSCVVVAIRTLFCMRVIEPSLLGFRANPLREYGDFFRAAQRDPLLDNYFAEVNARTAIALGHRRMAQFDVCCALTTQGIALTDLTPSALLHYAYQCRVHAVKYHAVGSRTRFSGLLAWQVLYEMGHFPPSTPPTLHAFVYAGQRSVEELVDRYQLRSPEIRRVLIDYLTRRKPDLDYSTLDNLAQILADRFWATVEAANPAQGDSLRLDQSTYEQWRESINWRRNGKPRLNIDGILVTVRGLYVDIHTWAIEDPGTWGRWAVPCPIPPRELRGSGRRQRRVKERTDSRTRARQPLLPALVEYAEQSYEQARILLGVGENAEPGAEFVHNGRRYERVGCRYDNQRPEHLPVRLRDMDTDETTNVTVREDLCFWRWAVIEILRLSGIRIEELVELTHLSLRQYQRPNGEVIALLVVAPSKSDRERVIPMSAELFHVIASVIRRLTGNGHTVPLAHRYDTHDRIWSDPLPFLFQRRIGSLIRVVAIATIHDWMRGICTELASTHTAFAGLHFTPHDFRRLFATELANSGLPIHIGAALLGHLNLQTTSGYITVFDEEVVRHYQTHLENRRQRRPAEEYREATADEWNDFVAHFDKRKVELGGCARPYGTGCQHEHACIRCPMLNINPKMLPRLDEIEADLLTRRVRAEREQWHGEIEGIDLTVAFLQQKREQTLRLTRLTEAGPVLLTLETPWSPT
ncbi:site-specific integrase [Nocardia sp. NPDC006630]|uniref:tyrosine-type recombinase/integrase n=1 Tax=Nocardia sp. NPDC006630 TaxID=3157181 RepID=UPI0033A64075